MLRILVCDSNSEDMSYLHSLINEYFLVAKSPYIISNCFNPEDAMQDYDNHQVYDIAFINVSEENDKGMQLAHHIRKHDRQCKIIITSTLKDFAYDSYRVAAYTYILKPYQIIEVKTILTDLDLIFKKIDGKFFTLNSKFGYYRIKYKNIIYMESFKRQVFFHCKDGTTISVNEKLDTIEEKLNDRRFVRCHKSYLANMDYIDRLENRQFVFINNTAVPIPKESLNTIKSKYLDYLENRL